MVRFIFPISAGIAVLTGIVGAVIYFVHHRNKRFY